MGLFMDTGIPKLITEAYLAVAKGDDTRDLIEKLLDVIGRQQTLITNLRDNYNEFRLTTSLDIATLKTIAKSQSASIEKLETGKRPLPPADLKELDHMLEKRRRENPPPQRRWVERITMEGPKVRTLKFNDGLTKREAFNGKEWIDAPNIIELSPPASPTVPAVDDNCSFTL